MRVSGSLVTAIVVGLALFVGPAQIAHGATLTVDSTADTSDFSTADGVCDTDDSVGNGPCTLRAAIEQSNFGAGTDTIAFSIAGAGPHTISPASSLPFITFPVIIDGTTEPDFAGTPIIELDGTSVPGATGLSFSGSSTVKSLVINRFSTGIALGSGDTIEGSYIGTDVTGTAALGNGTGVSISGPSNTIGGTASGAGNVISGNNPYNVRIWGTIADGNKVQGNYIGTDVTGTAALVDCIGVSIRDGDDNTIGGTVAGARNVISGNGCGGVEIERLLGFATGNKVEGNYIGTDVTGTAALGNSQGVTIWRAASNTIGGTAPGARNVISGNNFDGVRIGGFGNTGNKVEGNYIGTDTTGTLDLGNGTEGVQLRFNASGNTIGGTASGAGNVISGNGSYGVWIFQSGTTGNSIEGNFIGTQADGASALGNDSHGVRLDLDASNNTIGGPLAGAGNAIAFNGGDGVHIDGASTTGNTVQANSIHDNTGLGIENVSGGNTELTPPTVTATGSASGTSDCASCTIEVFSDDDDEGETFHGTATTAAGPCPCAWSFPGAVTGPNITATVTDSSRNTSEFSVSFLKDADGDGQGDGVDGCPNTATTWPTPIGDVDCDGWTSADETTITTDPNDACGFTAGSPTQSETWPPDLVESNAINISDVLRLKPVFGTAVPPTSPRFDIVPGGGISISDVLALKPFFGASCTP